MKKSIPLLIIISLIILSSFVFAVGSSTRSSNTQTNTTIQASTAVSCDSQSTTRERIKCRLEARAEELGTIEESCKNNPEESRCIALQNALTPCYSQSRGTEKRACLYRVVGIGIGAVNGATNEKKRELAASFLYELQERIEAKEKANIITPDQAAGLIDQIVTLKQKLLTNAPIAEIRTLMLEFKSSYRETMQ